MRTKQFIYSRVISCTITDEQFKFLLRLSLKHDYNLSCALRYLINREMEREGK